MIHWLIASFMPSRQRRLFSAIMSNPALNLAPFGRWTALKRRRLALR